MEGIPVKAVPMRIPVKSMPYRQAIYVKAPPEVPGVIPKEDRQWTFFFCVKYPSARSLHFSKRMVKVSRHSPNLMELNALF